MTTASAWLGAMVALAALVAPAAALAGPGSGTALITPSASVAAGSAGMWSIQYTAAEPMKNGRLRFTIPNNWTTPQTGSSTSAGYVTVSTNEPSASPAPSIGGQVITVDVDTLSTGNTITIKYGDDGAGANPGARAIAATATGSYTFFVASDPTATSPVNIAASPSLTVIAAVADHLEIAPSDTTVTAGAFAQYRLIVRDQYGNRAPVASNRTVNLFPSSGSFYPPGNTVTPITSVQINSGKTSARIDYRATLATAAGSPHTIFVLTQSGSPVLAGSDDVNVVAAALSTSQSTISATSPKTANGSDQSSVIVTSRDAYNNPRAGDTVAVGVTGNANQAGGGATNASGQATAAVTDLTAELVTVSATINGQPLTATAQIQFIAGSVDAGTSVVDATTPVVANGVAQSTISVTAKDVNGNLIAGQSVTLAVNPPGAGAVLTQPGGVTNASGIATGTLTSTTTGPRTVSATIGATPVNDTALINFSAGAVASFTWSGIDGAATAGDAEPVTITARDAQGNIITNYTGTVNLTTNSTGVGDAVVEWGVAGAQGTMTNLGGDDAQYTFVAGDNGVAMLTVTDTKAETIILTASGPASGVSSSIVVAPDQADKVQLVAGDGQSATVHTAVSTAPRVKVVDMFDNPVSGVSVKFRFLTPGGFVDAVSGGGVDSTRTTAADGTVQCDVWRMADLVSANPNRMRALIAGGSVPSYTFTGTSTAGPGTDLVLTPGSKNVTVASSEVVTATLRDQYGNLKSGEQVTVAVKTGIGTLAEDPGDPGTTTQVTSRVRQGTTDAAGKITVLYVAPGSAGNADVLDASTPAIAQTSVADVTYTTVANGATNLRVTWTGASTTTAGTAVQFMIEAVDGNGNRDTGNTAVVDLSPSGGGLQFSFSNFGVTITQAPLVAGVRTVWVRGTQAGNWVITASTGGLASDDESLDVTDTGVIDHYTVSTVGSVTAGVSFNVSVSARDMYDNLVDGANNSITLTAIDDITTATLTPDLLVTSASLADGVATVAEQYTKTDLIRVRVSNAGKEGISNVVTVNAAAAKRITIVSGDGTSVAAGASQVLTARVLDQFDNPVGGQTVSFQVTQGGGSVLPVSAPSAAGTGNASTTLTTGAVAGLNKVSATILDGNPPADEKVEFSVTGVAGGIANFTVVPQSYALVAGQTVSLTITAYDAGNNVVTSDNTTQVQLSSTGAAQFGSATGTLTAGVFVTTLRNDVVQNFTVTAVKQGFASPNGTSASISVSNAGTYAVTNTSGNGTVTAGNTRVLQATVRDAFNNVVPGALVTFSVLSAPDGTGYFTDTDGDPNDGIAAANASGVAQVTYHTALTAGTNTINAQILDGSPAGLEKATFTVNTTAGGIAYYTVQMNATTTTAGVSKTATITAYDANDNVVDDDATQVALSGDPGTGLVFGANPVTLTNGVASTSVTANLVQSYRVRASTQGNPSVTGLGPSVDVVPAAPAGTITATATQTTITANGTSTTTITSGVIKDAFGNTVTSGTVNVTAGIGGFIVGGGSRTIGLDGKIAFDLRSSTTTGTSTVTMNSATGTATGSINITFAPVPAFTAGAPTPSVVVPGTSVAFSVQVNNTTTTSVSLTTATTFSFSDGTRTFSATLAAPQNINGSSSTTLAFVSTPLNAAFLTASYAPTVTLVGTDAFASAVSTPVDLPAASLTVTSLEITGIVPAAGVVSRGQSSSAAVTVKNNGSQNVSLDSVTLVFIPSGLFTLNPVPGLPAVIAPGASVQINAPFTVQSGAVAQGYQIDAMASGTVSGQPVSDNSVAPHALANITVQNAAALAYQAGTMSPMTVSSGKPYGFSLQVKNSGEGNVVLDSTTTRLTFTDGTRTYSVAPVQPFGIAGGMTQALVFKTRYVAANFTPGSYAVTLNAAGNENGAPFNAPVAVSDPVTVQTPSAVVSGPGEAVNPERVSKTTTATFTVTLQNNGGATVTLTPATTTIRFASNQYVAALNPSGPVTLPPGSTTLQFLGATVSGSITNGSYFPTVQLNGFENGIAYSKSIALTDDIIVESPPSVAITGIFPSQPQFTTDQLKPIKVRMVVSNTGGNANFTAASIRFIHGGVDRTDRFIISTPSTFSGGSLLTSGETDTVVFDVQDNGGNTMQPGNMTIEGTLEVQDVNTSLPVYANTDLGGKGNLQVMSPATVTFDAVIPSLSKVTAGMTRVWKVRAVVRNTGGSDAVLTLSQPSTRLNFTPSAGWTVANATLAGGGATLSAGEVDTLVYNVTTSGSTPAPTSVTATTFATETNSGRTFSSTSPAGNVLVQAAGSIQVLSVVPSQASITEGTTLPWTITVTLSNTGESDVNLALGGSVSLAIQNQSTPPAFVIPASLAGGGTLLSGGETDQLVIPLTTAGTYTSRGPKTITVGVNGTEVNSAVPRSGNGNGSVTVQQAPDAQFVSLTPGTVSKLTSVAFQVDVTNPAASNRATLTLDRNLSRLRFGSGQYNVGLALASPVDIAPGATATLQFSSATIGAGIPVGVQADAQLELHWVHNGVAGTKTIPIGTAITVQNAPALQITAVRPSQRTMTRNQAPAGTITMVLTNSGGAAVNLDLSPSVTRLGFKTLSGVTVTSEYTLAAPGGLEAAGGTLLAGGATDSLVFDVTKAGVTAGSVIVNGYVGGIDQNSLLPVSDDTFDGGSGSLELQLAGVLSILSITPSQPAATVGQTTKAYTVKMAVRNTGGAAINVALPQAQTDIAFTGKTGFIHANATMPNGVTLSGGETDTLYFNVTTTGGPAGITAITGVVAGIENNTGEPRSDDTTSGGTGTITLQTPANLVVDSVTPSQPSVTQSTTAPWSTTVRLHNEGESAARLTLPAGFTINVQNESSPVPFAKPVDLEEGGVVLAGGANGTLVATTPSTPAFTSSGNKAINVTIAATELNSNRPLTPGGSGSVLVQTTPNLVIVGGVVPTPVTRETVVGFDIQVQNPGVSSATARLNRGATRVHFASQAFSAFLDVTSPDSIVGGQTVTLHFEGKVVSSSIALGPHDFNVNLDYTANRIARSELEVLAGGVTVQQAPQLQVQSIAVSQPTATVGQTDPWTATMTVINNGAADILLDLTKPKTYLTFVGPGGTDNNYQWSAGVMVSGDTTLNPSEVGQIRFTITQTGTQTGNIAIEGRVEGTDQAQIKIVTDDTFDGGRGSIVVQSAPGVTVAATHTSQPQVTAGQTGWTVRVVVANTGGADVALNLATASITVNGAGSYGNPTLQGGGNVLEGSAVDSLLFTINPAVNVTGARRIDASVPWTEINSSGSGTAGTASSGFGTITVESRAALRITSTVISSPNPAAVNVTQPFNVAVQVQNQGQADARNVRFRMVNKGTGASAIGPLTELPVVPGNQTVAFSLPVTAAAVPDNAETFTTSITNATDENSGLPSLVTFNAPADSVATVAVQTPAVLDITNVRPSQPTVTRGQSNPWNVIVRLRNTGAAGAVLTPPAAGDIDFSLSGAAKIDYVVTPPSQFGSGAAGWTLSGGATDSLIYTVVDTGNDPGVVDIAAAVAGTDFNDPPRAINDTGAGTVMVQDLAGVFIATTVPVGTVNHASADRDTVNTNFAFEIHVTVQNSGGEGVDSVRVDLTSDGGASGSTIAPASGKRQSIAAGASRDFVFRITSRATPDNLETFQAAIASGMRSANSNQDVFPQQPIDRRHDIVIRTPANLSTDLFVVSPPGSVGGVVSPGQQFTLGARVSNLGQALVAGAAQVTLTVPSGFTVQESLARSFAPNAVVAWTVTAPPVPQGAVPFDCAITTTPNDVNTGAPALVTKVSDTQSITVSSGGALASPVVSIFSPAGATDDTLSVQQNFTLRATVTATDETVDVGATLTLPPGFSILNGTLARDLGDGPFTKSQDFQLQAPASAVADAVLFVTFTGTDKNSGDPVASAADTVLATVVPRTSLAVSAFVAGPPEALDNTVAIGAQFTVTATVANLPGAADIAAPGSLQLTLPQGYSFGTGHTAQKPFVVGMPVSWVINAASQPSGPDQITVSIVNIPADENSGNPAQVRTGAANIAMLTEGAAVAVRNVSSAQNVGTGSAPAGAKDLDVLAFEIAYNVTDTSVQPAVVDTVALAILDRDGRAMGAGTVAQTLARIAIDLGGAAPYEVINPDTNPVRVAITGGTENQINPNSAIRAVVYLDLDASPRASELRVRVTNGMVVRDPGSGNLGVTDPLGQPLDGQVTSGPLVVLSSNFEEYAHNAPNPFRAGSAETQISYFLDAPSTVQIRIFDITGELVYEESIPSSDPRGQPGPQESPWDGRNMEGEVVRNGLYVCVLNAGSKSAKIRIAVAK